MSEAMHVVNLTIHGVGSIRITPDPENGCLDIIMFDSTKGHWTKFRILAFGANDTMPALDLREPVQPEPEEVES